MLVRAHHRRVAKDDGQVKTLQAFQYHQERPPHPALHPPLPAHGHGMPVSLGWRESAPRRAGAQHVEYAFQGVAVPDLRWPALPVGIPRQETFYLRKLFVRQNIEAIHTEFLG